jgi:hypothetical protein
MADYTDGRLYDTGDMLGTLEVVSVSYQEDAEGVKSNFVYGFRPHADMEEVRRLEVEHQAEQERLAAENEEE